MNNTTNAEQLIKELIAYTLATDKESLIYLLQRNGVKVESNISDKEIVMATLVASSKSVSFKNELIKLLSNKFPNAVDTFSEFVGDESDFGFTGIDDFMYASGDGWFSRIFKKKDATATTAKETKKPKKPNSITVGTPAPETTPDASDVDETKTKSNFWDFIKKNIFTTENVNKGLEFGFTALNNKLNQQNLNLQTQTNDILEKQKELLSKEKPPKPPAKNNTLTFVLIGVSVLALGGLIFVILKNRKK